jgi:acyl carrier protein
MNPAVQSVDDIRTWLLGKLREELDVDTPLDSACPLADYGLNSISAIGVTADLEDLLGVELDPTMFFDYPTIDELARFLKDELPDTP